MSTSLFEILKIGIGRSSSHTVGGAPRRNRNGTYLGTTCDPIAGLVQIPRIERRAIGAVEAINATGIAMRENGNHSVSLDQVIRTMYESGKDMQSRYKETPLGSLGLNIIEC
jgi:L-serine dehydratase